MSEIKNGRLGLYGTEHSKCNYMMTPCFKWLKQHDIISTYVQTVAEDPSIWCIGLEGLVTLFAL